MFNLYITIFGITWEEETFKYQILLLVISLLVWVFLVKMLFIGLKKRPHVNTYKSKFATYLVLLLLIVALAFASLYLVHAPFGLAKNFLGMSNEAALGTSFAIWSVLIGYISLRLSQLRKK